jgi:hypothetical protein
MCDITEGAFFFMLYVHVFMYHHLQYSTNCLERFFLFCGVVIRFTVCAVDRVGGLWGENGGGGMCNGLRFG